MERRARTAHALLLTAAAMALLGALLPAVASAQAPQITGGPTIVGTPQEGETLTATATWTGDPAPAATWAWLRCPKRPGSCSTIPGATSETYRLVAADVGSALRVRLTVANTEGAVEERSAATAVVEAAPPAPSPPPPLPTPTPSLTPMPAPDPSPTPVVAIPESMSGVAQASPPISMLDPFPVVRIRGLLTSTGAQVNLLTVRAPRGVLVVVRCRGSSCPVRRLALRSSSTRVRLTAFERHLRAGTRLRITVTKPGAIGKWTAIVLRRGLPPRRSDRCLYPDGRRPAACPTG